MVVHGRSQEEVDRTWVDEVHVQAICQLGDSRRDLVEMHALLLAIALDDKHDRLVTRWRG